MIRLALLATTLFLTSVSIASTASAEIIGVYLRNADEFILVRTDGDLMYCTRVGDGFEMCDGITEQADGSWAGTRMKHPDMPKFMTFSGMVLFSEASMLLEGCTIGNTQCESEIWVKQ